MAAKKPKTNTPKPDKKPMNIQDFKKASRVSANLELPSGAVVEVKNPGGMKMFLTGGAIPNSLMGIVQDAMDSGKGIKDEEMADLITAENGELNKDLLADMMTMIDNVTVNCWVMPPVTPLPENDGEEGVERDPELLYVDEVLEEDKLFVFQWATGGTKDIEQFRSEHNESLESLARLTGMEDTSE